MSSVNEYKKIKKLDLGKYAVETFQVITKKDKKKGWIDRYFVRQVNNMNGTIIEVDKAQYNELKTNPFYSNISFRWKITGKIKDVIVTNSNIIHKRDKEFPGIEDKLRRDLLKYYSP